ncbi:glycoside hydrolase family 85 protein [Lanmaoa asiatica]|nr:glycoside hydrolase family 85 protein [Lanmaoa asiatica]
MPLRGEGHSDLVRDEAPYFNSLAELDTWFAQPHDKLSGVLPYQPRPYIDGQSDSRGKLLVGQEFQLKLCNSDRSIRFAMIIKSVNRYMPSCTGTNASVTIAVDPYNERVRSFSHYRVAVPPSGWTNAAHKQGTKILGTLIFEHPESVPDCLQLVVGHGDYVVTDNKIPISRRYAVLLAELAHQRGFDGYLLNFEFDLPYNADQARALAAWILLLKAELRAKVGPHTQVMWYDSVIYDGQVSYQNRLNGFNLPFFLASDIFFTNYWWSPTTQDAMTQYFTNLSRPVPGLDASTDATSFTATKTLQSIYSGVDAWPGRSQYGDGGFCCYRAVTHTSPRGLSTALFAPGWTWEGATKDPSENWNEWWDNDRKLWLGPLKPGDTIPVPDSPEGPFKPMTAFFQDLQPPDPSNFVFYTHFSPGVGYSWFVEGKKVLDTKKGWTDIDKQSSIGNLVWPWPTPSWQDVQREEAAPTASTALDMADGYNGGNTLKLTLTYAGSKSEDTVKSIWLPVQSLTLTTRESFEARVVYKTTVGNDVDLDSYIYAKPLQNAESDSVDFTVDQAIVSDLPQGWTQQTINFTSISTRNTASVAIGFLVGVKPKNPSAQVTFSLSLSQLAVYPAPPPPRSVSVGTPSITWSQFTPIDVRVDDEESTTPAWLLQDTPAYRFPKFVYFNVYAAPPDRSVRTDPASAVFVGTTGLDGRANRFYVEKACFPAGWDEHAGVRFFVQGVTDRGEVLPWERCTTVDHGGNTA